jgi:hypothetical protein
MKKLLIIIFFLSTTISEANNVTYRCNLETPYFNQGGKWQYKILSLTFTIRNKSISIYDNEIKIKYDTNFIVLQTEPNIIAIDIYPDRTRFLTIDKKNSYATYSVNYTDGYHHGQYSIGRCSK